MEGQHNHPHHLGDQNSALCKLPGQDYQHDPQVSGALFGPSLLFFPAFYKAWGILSNFFPFSFVYSTVVAVLGYIQLGILPARQSFLSPIFDDDKRQRKYFKFLLKQVFLKHLLKT